MAQEEIWKDIGGYIGIYAISNFGRVFSFKTMKTRKTFINENGYERVTLINNQQYSTFLVHRLVATAFLPNKDNLPIVNHKDQIPGNNCASNLEWCTYFYNNTYNDVHLTKKKRVGRRIVQKSIDNVIVKTWDTAKQIINSGYSKACLYYCLSGRHKTHKGFKWEYAE